MRKTLKTANSPKSGTRRVHGISSSGGRSTWMRISPTASFVDPKLLQPHVLEADHSSNESEPVHRLALFSPKLELATTGAEPGLHHEDLLLIGNYLRISGKSLVGFIVSGLYLNMEFNF